MTYSKTRELRKEAHFGHITSNIDDDGLRTTTYIYEKKTAQPKERKLMHLTPSTKSRIRGALPLMMVYRHVHTSKKTLLPSADAEKRCQ